MIMLLPDFFTEYLINRLLNLLFINLIISSNEKYCMAMSFLNISGMINGFFIIAVYICNLFFMIKIMSQNDITIIYF